MSQKVKDVDEYLAAVTDDARDTLEKLRTAIKAAAPEATEVISYQVPTFKYQGRPLVSFGVAKNHCAFYVMSPSVMEAHEDELKTYNTAKGTIRFLVGQPLPDALVHTLVQARIEENQAARRT
ncbi:MAG: iron chaperone [Dehalococcoidia bacterium]